MAVLPRVLSLLGLLLAWGPCSPAPALEEVLGQFLHMLNLTDPGPRPRARSGPTEAPEYMLELYQRFSSSAAPPASLVRSFRNEDRSSPSVSSVSLRTHLLLFNVSVPPHERLISAELRLHTLLLRDSRRGPGSKVRAFERRPGSKVSAFERGPGSKVSVFDLRRGGDPLASRHVHRQGWEAFDMTSAVQHWRKHNIMTPRLEVHIESAFRKLDLDIDRSPDGKHEPALIVFSDDPSEARRAEAEEEEQNSRVRRSPDEDGCKRAEMYVDFKDIKWDSFILAPAGYQAFTCRGVCDYPLTREVTPTQHAIVQTLLNLKSSDRASKACCVPTELKPISLLYLNENGVVVLNNKYEGMVVKECGCR